MGEIHLGLRRRREARLPDVGHDAHDGHHAGAGAAAQREALADRVVGRPVLLRQRLVDHDDARRRLDIRLLHRAAAKQPHSHRLEVAGRHDLPVGAPPLLARCNRTPLDVDAQISARRNEWYAGDAACRRDTRQRRHAPRQLAIERDHTPGVRIPRARQIDRHRQDVVDAIPGIDRHQLGEAPRDQTRAHEQHEGNGHFGDDERAARALTSARGVASAAFAEHRLHVESRRLNRREKSEQHADDARRHECDHEYAQVDANVVEPRNVLRAQCDEETRADSGEQDADDTARERQDDALDEQLAEQSPATGAEGRADRHLAASALGAGEQQARDVRTGNEQHEADGT